MNRPLGTLGAAAAGALAMYYLDPDLGARRRARLAELVRAGLPGERRPRGRFRRGAWSGEAADPRDDAELRDRVQARVSQLVSHPRAIHVGVEAGVVRLSGRVLTKERDGLLEQVRLMPGVQRLVNAMSAHDNPQDIPWRPEPVSLASATR